MEFDCGTKSVAGATLVTVRVRNGVAVPRRVRVRNDLAGPVLPPRREGVPERGWDESGFVGVVPAGGERSLGYACPVDRESTAPRDCGAKPPVTVESLGRVDDAAADASADEVVRSLGRARPPADAVPTPSIGEASDGATAGETEVETGESGTGADGAKTETDESRARADAPPRRREPEAEALPAPVEAWFASVETRVGRAEQLTGATARDAAAVLETGGRVDGLPAAVATDERVLRSVATRASRLAERAAAVDAAPVVEAMGELS